jgi:H3 lysine-79-specific histone-lysine N-methyltransferase
MENPSKYATTYYSEFACRLDLLYGRPLKLGQVKLWRGDFLNDSATLDVLKSDHLVIFVNNLMFGSEQNNRLLETFLDLKDGTMVVSLVNFVPINYIINEKNMNDLRNILVMQSCCGYAPGSVSWTSSEGKYYIQRIDRSHITRFIENLNSRPSRR